MKKAEYIKNLEKRGYRKINDDQMAMDDLVFDIHQIDRTPESRNIGWCLKLNESESNLSLLPPPWSSASDVIINKGRKRKRR